MRGSAADNQNAAGARRGPSSGRLPTCADGFRRPRRLAGSCGPFLTVLRLLHFLQVTVSTVFSAFTVFTVSTVLQLLRVVAFTVFSAFTGLTVFTGYGLRYGGRIEDRREVWRIKGGGKTAGPAPVAITAASNHSTEARRHEAQRVEAGPSPVLSYSMG